MPNELQKIYVLIVDDETANLRLLIEYLSSSKFEATTAIDADEALKKISIKKPDIILLDVMMPGMDGFELCGILKKNVITKDIPVIFMTALAETPYKIKGFNTGAVDYITKPFDQEEVLARINSQLKFCKQKKELSEIISKLNESNAIKDEVFYTLAYQLREAFNIMLGISKPLTHSIGNFSAEKIQQLIGQLYKSAKISYQLIENMMEFVNIQTGYIKFHPVMLDIAGVIPEIIGIFQKDIFRKNLNITWDIPEKTYAYADSKMAYTILRNLVSNAIKFTPYNGKIHISSEVKGDFIEISVADTGIGINPDLIKQIFNIRFKYHALGTDGEEGTGLGLAICNAYIIRNSGELTVETTPGKGSVFSFTLVNGQKS